MTNDQIDELVSALADLSGLDEELVERCGGLVRAQRYDEAVSRTFVVLEERMRGLMGMHGLPRPLMANAEKEVQAILGQS
jgi:hypothetical protein